MTDTILAIRQLCFLETSTVIEASDEVMIPKWLFEGWLDLYPPSTPMIITIKAIDTGIERYVCVNGSGPDDAVYCPNWILENLGLNGDTDEYVNLMPYTAEIESATKISIRLLWDAGEQDVRAAVEEYLDKFHVLEPATMMTIPVGYMDIPMYVERTEPAPLVRLGGDVIVEFLEEEKEVSEDAGMESNSSSSSSASYAVEEEVQTETNTVEEDENKKPLTLEEIRQKRLAYLSKPS
jgi:hypothetical protein